ncbi:MAG: aryl-sulfate sulfotransferase [Planctomycetota bacterium]
MQLPEHWPEIRVHVCDEERMHPGPTLVNFSNHPLHVPLTAAVIDPRGETKWFYQRGPLEYRWDYTADLPDMRGDIDTRTTGKGVLVCGTNIVEGLARVHAFEVNWDGEVRWENLMINHHHIHKTPDGTYMFLTEDRRHFEAFDGAELIGDQIVEWDPRTSRVAWNWHLFDHHEPEVERHDYSHSNTIEPDPRDGSYYVSCRNMNSILKVDRATGAIVWRLGVGGDFEIDPADQFYHQHSPELQPNGNLLIYDNGTGRPEEVGGEYSRAVELEIDTGAMTARRAWEWRPEEPLYTPIWGDADRLPNGNTLMVFGTRTEGDTTRYFEVTPEGEVVWDVELCPSGWGSYRAERILRDIPVG